MRFTQNDRGATSPLTARRLLPSARLTRLVLSTALVASSGVALAGPQVSHQPPLRPVEDRGLLDAVADRSSQLISNVRSGAADLVDSAMNVLGVRYKLGGNSAETGFDCSGFTRYVYENSIGRVLPHRADEQANDPSLVKVDQKDLKPGDLVFFNTLRRTFSHVGIYLGDGKFIHSPRTGESVRIEDMNIAYWARHFTGARRVPELEQPGGSTAGAQLAALQQKLSAPSSVVTAANGAPVTVALATAPFGMSLGYGLRSGNALPTLPARSTAGFLPQHDPFTRPLTDR